MGNEKSTLSGEADIPEKLNEALRRIMDEMEIHPWSVPDRLSRQNVRGHGKARCPSCKRPWTSYQVSGEVDIKQQRVFRVWKQKCKDCGTAVVPEYRDHEFRAAVEEMLDRYEAKLYDRTPSVLVDSRSGPPHRKDLCEGCGYGTRDCRARAGTSNSVVRSVASTSDSSSGMSGAETIAFGVAGVAAVAAGVGLLGMAFNAAFGDADDSSSKSRRK